MIEEGSAIKAPGLPMMSKDTVRTEVTKAHKHRKLAIAHVLTYDVTKEAIEAGMDSLAHVFIDKPHDSDLVNLVAASGAFVAPCLVLNSSIMGKLGASSAADERVNSKRADLLLVDEDPTVNIGDSLSIKIVWCRDVILES